jgi:lysophospholipase L1-like esterase
VTRWSEVPAAPGGAHPTAWARRVAAVAPFALAGLLALVDRRLAAGLVLAGACLLVTLRRFRPSAANRVDRSVAAFATGAATLVSAALLGLVQLVVFAPLALLSLILRRDPLHARGEWQDRPVSAARTTRRTFGVESARRAPTSRAGRAVRRTPQVIGWAAVVVIANYGLGWTWDEYVGSHDDPDATVAAVRTQSDYRHVPAMADEPWSDRFWDEFAALRYEFVPFLLSRVRDVDGETISVRDQVRTTLRPTGATTTDVWVFGGGAAWGQGQRDEHTIPSELVRRAEAAGRPVRVWNFGQPGYSSLQSALWFEQLLAVRPPPDVVVVYDGTDDVAIQLETPSDRASHYNLDDITGAIGGRATAREEVDDLWEDYRETSLLTRVAERIGGIFAIAPAAAEEDLAARVQRLHGESLALFEDLAAMHGVPTVFAWQAASGVTGDRGAYRDLAARDDRAVDLSRVLDGHEDHYLDGVLTDEDGARLVAEALWPLVEARLS